MTTGFLSSLFSFVADLFDQLSRRDTDGNSSDPTVPLDENLKQTVTIHGRDYQRYSLQNNVYFSPIDEVLTEPLLAIANVFCWSATVDSNKGELQ
jgi:hypothetical protein